MSEKYRKNVWPDDAAERIKSLRERGAAWRIIAESFGANAATVRAKAKELGVFVGVNRYFTSYDDAVIREDYIAHVDLNVTAAKLGRTRGNITQRILRKHSDLLNTVRDQLVTRAVKKFGNSVLDNDPDARRSVEKARDKMLAAKAAARVAAISAKDRHNNKTIELMLSQIEQGKPRNLAMFEARATGISLEKIAACFDITRERVRQICDAEAFRIASSVQSNGHDESLPPERDILDVASRALHS